MEKGPEMPRKGQSVSPILHLSSGDVWHRTQLLTILQDVCASIPTQIPSSIEKMPPQIDKTPGGLGDDPLCASEVVDWFQCPR